MFLNSTFFFAETSIFLLLVTYAYIVHCDFSEGIIGTVRGEGGGAGRFWFGNDEIYLIRSLGSVIFF